MKTQFGVGTLQDKEGLAVDDDHEKVILLNNLFSSVFTIEDTSTIPATEESFDGPKLDNVPIIEDMIVTKMDKLKSTSSLVQTKSIQES